MENVVNDWLNDGELKYDDNGEEITDYVAHARRQDTNVWKRIVKTS